MYDFLVKIRMMIKFAREKKLKFVFWLVDYKEIRNAYSKEDQMCFYEYPEYIPFYAMHDYTVDLAPDNGHPGVKSNQNIAKAVIDHIERIYPNA
jgi:lysophospholipase L1-like esterase